MGRADGVTLDHDGRPFYSTFSLCAADLETGELGVAVTSRVPFVGRVVPWVRAGVGAVATQAWAVIEYGIRGLDLLAGGSEPEATLGQLLADDGDRELRQVGLVDARGRAAAHTGGANGEWAGHRCGDGYTAQGNILVGPAVVDAVAEHFESTAGLGMPLAERLMTALEAGQAKGGDGRWGERQSAAVRVADPRSPGPCGDHISLAIDVAEHATPVAEMKRIYLTTAERLGYRSFSEIAGRDVVELKEKLHVLGYWRPDGDGVPSPPAWDIDLDLRASDRDAFDRAVAAFRVRQAAYRAEVETFDPEARGAVDAFRQAHGLNYPGTPRGLVDGRFVACLQRVLAERLGATRRSGSAPD